jgi:hypothetical protein
MRRSFPVSGLRVLGLALGVLASGVTVGAAQAAVPASVFGRWIERFPNGDGMVTEFTGAAISSYPVDSEGKPTAAPTAMPVTYVDLGGPMLGVSFQGGGGAILAEKTANAITLDFPGIGAHELTRVKEDPLPAA